jgi:hypothetical protein
MFKKAKKSKVLSFDEEEGEETAPQQLQPEPEPAAPVP